MIYKRKPHNFSPSFEVVSCFFEYESKILLLKRHQNKSQGGKWGVPAGKINNNEDKTMAMIREMQEETGVKINANDLQFFTTIYVHHASDFIYHMFFYRTKQPQKITLSNYEHEEYKWVAINEAFTLPLVDDLDECIRMFYFKT